MSEVRARPQCSLLGPLTGRVSHRFRKHRKAVVSAGDKKLPNGLLEEQGEGLRAVVSFPRVSSALSGASTIQARPCALRSVQGPWGLPSRWTRLLLSWPALPCLPLT